MLLLQVGGCAAAARGAVSKIFTYCTSTHTYEYEACPSKCMAVASRSRRETKIRKCYIFEISCCNFILFFPWNCDRGGNTTTPRCIFWLPILDGDTSCYPLNIQVTFPYHISVWPYIKAHAGNICKNLFGRRRAVKWSGEETFLRTGCVRQCLAEEEKTPNQRRAAFSIRRKGKALSSSLRGFYKNERAKKPTCVSELIHLD